MACKVITQFRAKPGHAEDLLGLLKKYVPESARHASLRRRPAPLKTRKPVPSVAGDGTDHRSRR